MLESYQIGAASGAYRSTRFGSEGIRVWVYDLSPSYSADLNAKCEQLGYQVQPTHTVLEKRPFLRDYVTSAEGSCVGVKRRDALELAVLQDSSSARHLTAATKVWASEAASRCGSDGH